MHFGMCSSFFVFYICLRWHRVAGKKRDDALQMPPVCFRGEEGMHFSMCASFLVSKICSGWISVAGKKRKDALQRRLVGFRGEEGFNAVPYTHPTLRTFAPGSIPLDADS